MAQRWSSRRARKRKAATRKGAGALRVSAVSVLAGVLLAMPAHASDGMGAIAPDDSIWHLDQVVRLTDHAPAPAGPVRTAPAVAQDPATLQGGAQPARSRGWSLEDGAASFAWENDIFGGTDSNYTNGVQFNVTSGPAAELPLTSLWARLVPQQIVPNYSNWRTGIGFGQSIFTPEDISLPEPDPLDRPYAGWTYVKFSFFGERWGATANVTERTLDIAEIDIGLVGDASGGAWVQSEFHQAIDGQDPNGWRFQLKDEPAFVVRLARQRRLNLLEFGPPGRRLELDGELQTNVAFGTVETSGAIGGGFRFGTGLTHDFGPPRVRPALGGASFFGPERGWSWYLFAGAEGRLVGRNIFLDGNTFRDSRSVEKENIVIDGQAGLALRAGRARFTFTYVHRTEEFEGQVGPSRFGAGTVSWRF